MTITKGVKLRKRLFFFLLVLFIDTCLSTAHAFLITPVGAQYSFTPKTTFAYDETPWIWVDVPEGSALPGMYPRLAVMTEWNYDNGGIQAYATASFSEEFFPSGFYDQWVKLNLWDSFKEPGTWNINATYTIYTLNGWTPNILSSGSAATSFDVQPISEPSSLFLLGIGLVGLIRKSTLILLK